ncbi:Neutral/alkaline non-lysosomal ceramidase, N-terminal [Daejeonella rubra]|uniref:Neutral/alkaline non-lysosomal ceramidase, N-terminal n=1 Tax=Daejeonella rubra TaxID=990371 RepID=A0A1G9W8E7_9SPHI|nr:neutral/alkaline non-lysosomal ceramidase N-terminal domain-containing protein [Daejeonella rubra]SDM80295.1 Neutral/alkaline non-lysosomal ceramidase, N-terminal [Daejeonella rubra]
MKKLFSCIIISVQIILLSERPAAQENSHSGWKAGVASVVITPEESLWMAGFAHRTKPSDGKLHELWAKALVIEDASGKQALLITTDLSGIPKSISDSIRNQLEKRFKFSRSQIIFNTSHTHSGPVLVDALWDLYPLDDTQKERITKYTKKFELQIESIVRKALGSMKPVNISSENGITRFAVNRRNNIENKIDAQTDLKGPSDYAVPVIRVSDQKGKILALAFGYACHNTVLHGYEWSGDYAGYAQITLEKAHPGATALFFQGCGGNQNALPRKTVPLATQYGKELALAVDAVLEGEMKILEPKLSTAYSEVKLELEKAPSKDELLTIVSKETGYIKNWALNMIKKADKGETFISSYPYPVQFWQLGNQSIVALGGEPVVDYAINLKKVFGPDLFVMGYSNDVMAYIPTAEILREGGYEGHTSQMAFGMPAKWKESIEPTIMREVMILAEQLGVKAKPKP